MRCLRNYTGRSHAAASLSVAAGEAITERGTAILCTRARQQAGLLLARVLGRHVYTKFCSTQLTQYDVSVLHDHVLPHVYYGKATHEWQRRRPAVVTAAHRVGACSPLATCGSRPNMCQFCCGWRRKDITHEDVRFARRVSARQRLRTRRSRWAAISKAEASCPLCTLCCSARWSCL